jgi:hypothetical protein
MIADIVANVEPIYKQWYASSYENMFYRDRPAMGMIAKERAGGEQVKQPIKISQGPGQSATFTNALGNVGLSVRRPFLGDWGLDYSLAQVQNTLIELSQDNKGAVVKALADETESAVDALAQRFEHDLFRSGYGDLGVVLSGQATPTITLTLRSDAQNFFPGQVVVAAPAVNTGVLLNAGASIVVSSVDRDAGTVTSAGNWTASIAGLIATSVLFQQGDRTSAATPTPLKVVGFAGWLPLVAPVGGDSFFGVDRSLDPVSLAGVRVSGLGKPISQAIYDLAVRIGENGGAPDACFISFDAFGKLATELDNRAIYDNIQGAGITISYEAITVAGPKGRIRVFPSTFCPMDRLFVITKRDWTIYCGGGANPMFPSLKGVSLLDVSSADAVQVRHKTLAQLMCAAPGHSGVSQLS